MAQSLARNLIHLIYSTKNRERRISAPVRAKLFAYQAGILREWESPAIAIGGDSDHVHALFTLSKNHALCDVVEAVKKGSSKWMKTQGDEFGGFHWQSGYGAFSVSQSHVPRARAGASRSSRSIIEQPRFRTSVACSSNDTRSNTMSDTCGIDALARPFRANDGCGLPVSQGVALGCHVCGPSGQNV